MHILEKLLLLVALVIFLPLAAHGIVNPEAYGSAECRTAVRNHVPRCNTYGLAPTDLLGSFTIEEIENCRAECDECCATLPQYGDAAQLLQGIQKLCGCASDIILAPESAIECATETLLQDSDLRDFLVSNGFLEPDVFSPDPPPGPGSRPTEKTSLQGMEQVPSTEISLAPWYVRAAAFLAVIACDEIADFTVALLVDTCGDGCQRDFPVGSELPPPPPPPPTGGGGGSGGGGNGGGPSGGPGEGGGSGGGGGGGINCYDFTGDPCVTSDGFDGSFDTSCECIADTDVSSCEQGEFCGVTQECWICLYDPDPPPWCEHLLCFDP